MVWCFVAERPRIGGHGALPTQVCGSALLRFCQGQAGQDRAAAELETLHSPPGPDGTRLGNGEVHTPESPWNESVPSFPAAKFQDPPVCPTA
ncbi:hypothetical protein VTJ04DRAFT_456 [Mycothermus thermophilus]|uniref:uncharacterized protein n=1 Tax=Humicola insolens TaxID=85995 RepID=UPI0037441EC6